MATVEEILALPAREALEKLVSLGAEGNELFGQLPPQKQAEILGARTEEEKGTPARKRRPDPPPPPTPRQKWQRRFHELRHVPGTKQWLPWRRMVNDAEDINEDHKPDWAILKSIQDMIDEGVAEKYFGPTYKVYPMAEIKWTGIDFNTPESISPPPSAYAFDRDNRMAAHANAQDEYSALLEAGGFPEAEDRVKEMAYLWYYLPKDDAPGYWVVAPTRKWMGYSLKTGDARVSNGRSDNDAQRFPSLMEAVLFIEEISGMDLDVPDGDSVPDGAPDDMPMPVEDNTGGPSGTIR